MVCFYYHTSGKSLARSKRVLHTLVTIVTVAMAQVVCDRGSGGFVICLCGRDFGGGGGGFFVFAIVVVDLVMEVLALSLWSWF